MTELYLHRFKKNTIKAIKNNNITPEGVTDGNDRLMGNNQIKSILAKGAVRNPDIDGDVFVYPDPVSGYGKVNIMNSFLQLRIQ